MANLRNFLFFLSIILLFVYVFNFTPQVPMFDQWALVPLFQDASLGNLWAQHNVHRMIIPNVIYLSLAKTSHWDLRWETITSLIFFVILMLLIYGAFARQNNNNLASWLFALAVLTQLTPVHHENLLWGWQLQLTLCALMVFIAISRRSILALFVASFSFFTGLLGWMVCLFIFMRTKASKMPFIIMALIIFAVYFYGLNLNDGGLGNLWQVPAYFSIYMGANFIITYKIGVLLTPLLWLTGVWGLLFTLLGINLVKKTWRMDVQKTVIPYSMMLFGVMNAAATSIGRIDFGLPLALLSRYHIFQMFYFLGVIWLAILYWQENNRLQKYSRAVTALFIALIVLNWVGGVAFGIAKVRRLAPVIREIKTKAENISDETARIVYHDPIVLRERIKILKQKKYNLFRD